MKYFDIGLAHQELTCSITDLNALHAWLHPLMGADGETNLMVLQHFYMKNVRCIRDMLRLWSENQGRWEAEILSEVGSIGKKKVLSELSDLLASSLYTVEWDEEMESISPPGGSILPLLLFLSLLTDYKYRAICQSDNLPEKPDDKDVEDVDDNVVPVAFGTEQIGDRDRGVESIPERDIQSVQHREKQHDDSGEGGE